MKAMVTWKGEGDEGPDAVEWRHTTFKKGEAVEVTDPQTVLKAQGNPSYKVQITEKESPPEQKVVPLVTETSAQHAVPKPGEPLVPKTEPLPPPSDEHEGENQPDEGVVRSASAPLARAHPKGRR